MRTGLHLQRLLLPTKDQAFSVLVGVSVLRQLSDVVPEGLERERERGRESQMQSFDYACIASALICNLSVCLDVQNGVLLLVSERYWVARKPTNVEALART